MPANIIASKIKASSVLRAAIVMVTGAGIVTLSACHDREKPSPNQVIDSRNPVQIDTLPHGTIAAVRGSPEDQLARFMASNDLPPRSFRFPSEEFGPWSDQLTPPTAGTLSVIALVLRDYPRAHVTLEGFTDAEGSDEQNRTLSQGRVETLRKLLVARGVAASQITTIRRGAAKPIATNSTEEGRRQNRRIELIVTAK